MALGVQDSAQQEPGKKGISPISGCSPPVEYQFKKGHPGGPGRPRGAWPRAALARKLAKGWQDDADAANDDEKIGAGALRLAQELYEAALAADDAKVRAICAVIHEVEGKPQERVEHSGTATLNAVFAEPQEPE